MKVGTFNINDYLQKLYENDESESNNIGIGIIIPPENKKSYDWLKKEYDKGKTEVKVEMSSHTFKPGYSTEGAKDFKPGMYGQVKTSENNNVNKTTSTLPETKFPGMSDKTIKEDSDKNKSNGNIKKQSMKIDIKKAKEKTSEKTSEESNDDKNDKKTI